MDGISKEDFHETIDKLARSMQAGFDEIKKDAQRDRTALKTELESKLFETRMEIRHEVRDAKEDIIANVRALQDEVEKQDIRNREDVDHLYKVMGKLQERLGVQ
jgi:F0F1-type ATP synthase membrane subunit b/b'